MVQEATGLIQSFFFTENDSVCESPVVDLSALVNQSGESPYCLWIRGYQVQNKVISLPGG